VLPMFCCYTIKLLEIRCCFFISDMLEYGCTRLEIGVQSVYEDVARDTNRYSFSFVALHVDHII